MARKKSDWVLNGQLPRPVWEATKNDYKGRKVSDKKIKAQQDWTGINKYGQKVTTRYTVDNRGGGDLRPILSSKPVLQEQLRDKKRPKWALSEGEKMFMKDRTQAVAEYNAAHGYSYNNPKAAELDHIYGSRTPQHPAFIKPRERLVNQRKGGQAADVGPTVDLSKRPEPTKPKNGHTNGFGTSNNNGTKTVTASFKYDQPSLKGLRLAAKTAAFAGAALPHAFGIGASAAEVIARDRIAKRTGNTVDNIQSQIAQFGAAADAVSLAPTPVTVVGGAVISTGADLVNGSIDVVRDSLDILKRHGLRL
jgi:hypothetical protein